MKTEPAIIIGALAAAATALVGYFASNGTITPAAATTATTLITFIAGLVTRAFVSPVKG